MRITLHIDRLVLDGVSLAPQQALRLREALEQELAQLLGQNGVAPGLLHSGALATLTGPAITPQRLPAALGEQIAGAVCAAIGNRAVPARADPLEKTRMAEGRIGRSSHDSASEKEDRR